LAHPDYTSARGIFRKEGLNATPGFPDGSDERRRSALRLCPCQGTGAARSLHHSPRIGEPDFHPAEPVIDAVQKALKEGKDRYCPVAGVAALREELAAYLLRTRNLNILPESVVIAPGCKIALFLALMALVEPGDEVLFPEPGFPGYSSITLGLGGVPVPFELAERN